MDDSARVITVDSEGTEVIGNGTIVGWGIVVKEESGWVKPYKPSEQLRVRYVLLFNKNVFRFLAVNVIVI